MVKRICLFAQYDPAPGLPPQTRHYLRQLAACGYTIHVALSGRETPDVATLTQLRAGIENLPVQFHARPNGGLDFGAWQFLVMRGITDTADEILLANDSVFGPLQPLAPIVQHMRGGDYDVWGMVHSRAVVDHLQSWFVNFTGAAFRHPAIIRIFAQPFNAMSKDEIVLHGELGLGLAITAAGLRKGASWSGTRGFARLIATNPMHTDWRSVLRSGHAPFIKTELLRDNPSAIQGVEGWRAMIPDPAFFDPDWIEAYLAAHPSRPSARRATWRGKLVQALASEDRVFALTRLAAGQFRMRR
ncbi:rhamnan synthesis F family protein [Acidomonas methanolica]|nr:rhamnan synthesis F family protein [Acidomonas methanolica]